MNTIVKQIQDLKAQRQAWEELFASEIAAIDAQLEAIRAALDEGVRSRESEDSSQESGDNRVGGGITPAVLPHHRTYGSVSGGSYDD